MKVPPKRKGNGSSGSCHLTQSARLNESPSKKEGKCGVLSCGGHSHVSASMKVPPKRKGNPVLRAPGRRAPCLNESPSQKEGKLVSERPSLGPTATPQ